MLPSFESDHRNGLHSGAPCPDSCTLCAAGPFKPGDVIEDSYANPAVVLNVNAIGLPSQIMQTVGSDRGRTTYPPRYIRRIESETSAERAREVARSEWRAGRRWVTTTRTGAR